MLLFNVVFQNLKKILFFVRASRLITKVLTLLILLLRIFKKLRYLLMYAKSFSWDKRHHYQVLKLRNFLNFIDQLRDLRVRPRTEDDLLIFFEVLCLAIGFQIRGFLLNIVHFVLLLFLVTIILDHKVTFTWELIVGSLLAFLSQIRMYFVDLLIINELVNSFLVQYRNFRFLWILVCLVFILK